MARRLQRLRARKLRPSEQLYTELCGEAAEPLPMQSRPAAAEPPPPPQPMSSGPQAVPAAVPAAWPPASAFEAALALALLTLPSVAAGRYDGCTVKSSRGRAK